MKYIVAKSVEEALVALYQAEGNGLILAGGTDLMIDLANEKKNPDVIVDITAIPKLHEITLRGNELVIGAAATLTEITHSPLVKQYFPSLALGCGSVGSLQIRNSATLAGNVMSAQPAADGAMALAPLDPSFLVCSLGGQRITKMADMYAGFARSAIDSSRELVKEISVPLPKAFEASSFLRLELRKSLSLPMLNVGAMLDYTGERVNWVRITMGPVGVGPVRATSAEQWLTGRKLTEDNMVRAGLLCMVDAKPRSNPLRGSKEYREQVLPVLVKRALENIAAQLDVKY